MLNWLAYTYLSANGYGKYSSRMVAALRKAGVSVRPELAGAVGHPDWLLAERGWPAAKEAWDCLTVSCLPPYYLHKLPNGSGPHWLLTMTEGGKLPDGWADTINKSGVERVIVPCKHNAEVFREGGVLAPVSVIPGGTDPDEFPLYTEARPKRPYTFLTIADRGYRKGWEEVRRAFYVAFGGKTTGRQDVRLIIKCRPGGNEAIELVVKTGIIDADPRVAYLVDDVDNLRSLYERVDCLALPSRTEGWGMPHREAAMMGLPVITQAFSGLDDGHTREWAIVVEKGQMQPIDDLGKHIAGEWRVADIDDLATKMHWCYDFPNAARHLGGYGAKWLRATQTWDHAAAKLIALMQQEGVLEGGAPQVAQPETPTVHQEWVDAFNARMVKVTA